MKIIKDEKILRIPVEPKTYSSEDIERISDILKFELDKHKGFGISANQLGFSDRICYINVIDPMILVNPRIIKKSNEMVVYIEQCLSLDKTMMKPLKTKRHVSITVETDNLGTIEFGKNEKTEWKNSEDFWNDLDLRESVCAQHEIDHLNGRLITDKDVRYYDTVVSGHKYGRNDRVMVSLPDGSTEFMKYKKAIPYLEAGCTLI